MISTRISSTSSATNTGTLRISSWRPTISLPSPGCESTASDTAHQVSMPFIAAATAHAPSRYQDSVDVRGPFSGVSRRAMPAKSIPQKASARTTDQRAAPKVRSPIRSRRANSVVP